LIGAIGDHHVFPKPHQLMNELISPDSFRFWVTWKVQCSRSIITDQVSWDFSTMREKICLDYSSLSEVYIYRNIQNMITIVAVQTNNDDNFLSCSYNYAHWDYTKSRMLNRSELFWMLTSPSLWRH
jgi:hypothetical protein